MANFSCTPSTFSSLSIPGASITSLTTTLVQNYTASAPLFSKPNHGDIPPTTLDVCNVTITHTHNNNTKLRPVLTQVWLPASTWNGRFQATGGGGFATGLDSLTYVFLSGAVAEGYATVSTNAGLNITDAGGSDAYKWALDDAGNLNVDMLEYFVHGHLGDMSAIGKGAVELYYGEKPKYSYYTGCSKGGHQGYELAQKYAGEYDGIAAAAPAFFWDEMPEWYWKPQVMNQEKIYPWTCEFNALREAMLKACDGLDGVEDSVLQDPDVCTFDAWEMLGMQVECEEAGQKVNISETAVKIAEGEWTGRTPWAERFNSKTGGYDTAFEVFPPTTCANGTCAPNPFPFLIWWIKTFVKKDNTFDLVNMTEEEYLAVRDQSKEEFENIIGTPNYDLSAFKKSGGKLITYQGLSDPAITYNNTRRFYTAAAEGDDEVDEYYRLFEAPGLGHCTGGKGAYPHSTFAALVDWVENGKAPDTLEAASMPDEAGDVIKRTLCKYPKKSKYDGEGDPNESASWSCE